MVKLVRKWPMADCYFQHCEGSSNVSYNINVLTFVSITVNTCTYWLQHAYRVHIFYIGTTRCARLLGDKYKFNANVRDKDNKITKMHYLLHSMNFRI